MDITFVHLLMLYARNAWLENMTQFVEFITNIPKAIQPRDEVRVAILDDGIDLIQAGLDRCIGCSFYTETLEDFTRINPYYFSSTGHGTLMATLVQKSCPKAQLYVARVGQGRSSTGILQPTAPSAANVSPSNIPTYTILTMTYRQSDGLSDSKFTSFP